jgi:hypothetical protein
MVHTLESVSENSLMRGISNAVPSAERLPLSGMQRNAKTMFAFGHKASPYAPWICSWVWRGDLTSLFTKHL